MCIQFPGMELFWHFLSEVDFSAPAAVASNGQASTALRAPDANDHEPRLPPHPEPEQEPGSESIHMEGVSFSASECFIFKNAVLLG